jgi:NTE family protein
MEAVRTAGKASASPGVATDQFVRFVVDPIRKGTYWGIRQTITTYGQPPVLPCPLDRTALLAAEPTRLKQIDDGLQERLINWGYAICDASLRKYFDPPPSAPQGFPYPATGV